MQRNSFYGTNNGMRGASYRGHAVVAPIAPHAFASTPNIATSSQRMQNGPHLRAGQRVSSAPTRIQNAELGNNISRSRYLDALPVSSSSNLPSLSRKSGSKDDSVITGTAEVVSGTKRPHSAIITSASSQNLAPLPISSLVKPSPDRYRRPNNRRVESSATGQQPSSQTAAAPSSGMLNRTQFYGNTTQKQSMPMSSYPSFNSLMPPLSKPTIDFTPAGVTDDMQLNRQVAQDQAKIYRRRTIHITDASHFSGMPTGSLQQGSRQVSSANGRIDQQRRPLRSSPVTAFRPTSFHGSTGRVNSAHSSHSRPNLATKQEAGGSMVSSNPSFSSSKSQAAIALAKQASLKLDVPILINIPPQASSTERKRVANPSLLSKPMIMSPEIPKPKCSSKSTYAQVDNSNSSSAHTQQLAALNEKEGKKSKISQLRKASSFESVTELQKAMAKISQQQEAKGIGAGVYSGQGNLFTGSTNNLPISLTASSASVKTGKMSKGMKKFTRSLVGLFRPKSVIDVPATDSAVPQASQAQVSMITVGAEQEKVNVNANPHDQISGGTGYSKLERNSINAAALLTERLGSSSKDNFVARRSIVGEEKEHAKVLATVKKGILKRSCTDSSNSSPVIQPVDSQAPSFQLPQTPHSNESPNSSAPSTPNDEQQDHPKIDSVTLGSEDYYIPSIWRYRDSKSMPGTPQGSVAKRNATFSPRIQFYDTWPSREYDRRGEIAVCNRLTPKLVQQIKEELNTFKMEMEVHENSKIYTNLL